MEAFFKTKLTCEDTFYVEVVLFFANNLISINKYFFRGNKKEQQLKKS